MSASDKQEGGDHYKKITPEPWDVMYGWNREHYIGFLRYCALKRLGRWDGKDGALKEVRKAIHELQRLEEVLAEDERVRVSGAPYEIHRKDIHQHRAEVFRAPNGTPPEPDTVS